MGREVRRVPADWQHPKDTKTGFYVPLFDGKDYDHRVREWDEEAAKWDEGMISDYNGGWQPIGGVESKTYSEWSGERPKSEDYMPRWTDSERTHLMMYEDTSEGTPISPAFETPEELAQWLVDNKSSAFGNYTGSYERWLHVARGGFAPSMVVITAGVVSGVDAP